MEDLARASGLSKSSLYHHIDGKEQLLRLALERAVEPLFAVTREPGAVRAGRSTGSSTWSAARSRCSPTGCPYVTLLLRVHGNTEVERWALEQRREFDRFVAALVRAGGARGRRPGRPGPRRRHPAALRDDQLAVEWYRPDGRRRDARLERRPTSRTRSCGSPSTASADDDDAQAVGPRYLRAGVSYFGVAWMSSVNAWINILACR